MRFFWKIVLLTAVPIGGYWLYKKGKRSSEIGEQSEPKEENQAASTSHPSSGRRAAAKKDGIDPKRQPRNKNKEIKPAQIIERLTEIDGVTSRVAENLVKKGIYSREDLKSLSEEELKEIKGIGPKRSAKILNLE